MARKFAHNAQYVVDCVDALELFETFWFPSTIRCGKNSIAQHFKRKGKIVKCCTAKHDGAKGYLFVRIK